MTASRLLVAPVLLVLAASASAADDDFARAAALVKPQPTEHQWAKIPWFISVAEAQKKAAAEGKPLVLARAAQGCVVGCL